jgi:tetratricopeptide (TPR) repeat protein
MPSLNRYVSTSLLLALILLLAYAHSINFPFQFDDYNVIVYEPKVHSLSAWWQSMLSMRPLLKLSYALNWQLEQAPRFFRTFNLFIHFVTSILVWRLCGQLLPILRRSDDNTNKIALLTAFLFALHPAHTEVVTYISSRSTGLMSMLCMASLISWVKLNHTDFKNSRYLVASVIFWLLAVLVKESAIILPAIAGLIQWFCYPQLLQFKKIKYRFAYVFLFIMPITTFLYLIPQYQRLVLKVFDIDTLINQLAIEPIAHIHYLTNTIFGLNLNVDYMIGNPSIFFSFTCGVLIIALIFFAFKLKRQYSLFSFSVLWWFIFLIPSNSIIPRLDLMNDRQIYLASIGLILIISTCVIRLSVKLKLLSWMPPAALVVLAINATWLRNWDYESEISLWQSSLRQQVNNSRAWNNLGYAYLIANKKQDAEKAFKNALKLNPSNYKAHYNLQKLNHP